MTDELSKNPITNLARDYSAGKLEKYEYIDRMHKFNKSLSYIANRIKDTDIQKIEIVDDLLIFTTRRMGIKMAFHGLDRRGVPFDMINFGEYEVEDEQVLHFIVSNSKTIFDIGANIGWYSILFSKINPSSLIYSFEPIGETYKYLVTNTVLNQSLNVNLYNLGLKDSAGLAKYYYFPEGSVLASERNVIESSKAKTVLCPVSTLDSFVETQLRKDENIDFIKCDVEGAEKMVVEGGIGVISQMLPALFIELFAKWTQKFGYHPNDLIRRLSSLGYKCYMYLDDTLQEFSTYREIEGERLNFFFLHPSKHKKVIDKFG